ncbi:glycosyltransferase family 2 protein [Wohlfahrtiimonas chitiniclastica]|uniref:glycosyltransferase family 2 protein n=1 Tax=Wohlfahrtiimonas chitiniclastica TaxID=400946 RepID=UPI0024BB277F|nr:glycosyltransferase family 2 protein [Wohlfahrtiimonas chitiniclastica]WHR56026.1 glycosyltransferase family 2 protein [Wohlfahrtiimonas chitiniclastica]
MSKLISIIIPMFNEENNISNCLENLYSQSSQDFHVIFVNDGSTDNTVKILSEQLSSNIPLFSYEILNQENLGAAKARESGILNAETAYVMIFDCDDKISENTIETHMNSIIKEKDIDIIMPDFLIEGDNGYKKFTFYNQKIIYSGLECLEHSLGRWGVHGCVCAKKNIFEKSYNEYRKYNSEEKNFINNDEVITRLNFLFSKKIVRNNATYFYQNNLESTTKKINQNRYLMLNNAVILYKLFGRNMGAISINTVKELVSVLWGTTVYLMKHKKQISNKETWKQELDKVYKYIEQNQISSQLLFKSKVQLFLSKLIHYVI